MPIATGNISQQIAVPTSGTPQTRIDWISADNVGVFAAAAFDDLQRLKRYETDLAGTAVTMDDRTTMLANGTGKRVSAVTSLDDEMVARGDHPGASVRSGTMSIWMRFVAGTCC